MFGHIVGIFPCIGLRHRPYYMVGNGRYLQTSSLPGGLAIFVWFSQGFPMVKPPFSYAFLWSTRFFPAVPDEDGQPSQLVFRRRQHLLKHKTFRGQRGMGEKYGKSKAFKSSTGRETDDFKIFQCILTVYKWLQCEHFRVLMWQYGFIC